MQQVALSLGKGHCGFSIKKTLQLKYNGIQTSKRLLYFQRDSIYLTWLVWTSCQSIKLVDLILSRNQ